MVDIKIQVPQGYLTVDNNIGFGVNYSIDDVRDITKKNTSYSKTVTLLGDKTTNFLMGQLFDVKSDFSAFNPNYKTPASIIVNSTVIIDGFMQLKSIKKTQAQDQEGSYIQYEVVIFNDVIDFYSKIGDSLLTDLDFSEYDHTYTNANIENTWTNTSGYTYPLMYKGTDTYITNDFKPAIFYKTYLEKIANATGFELGGSFLNNPSFVREIIPFNGPLINLPESEWQRRRFRVGMTGSSQTLTTNKLLRGGVFSLSTLGSTSNFVASLATPYSGITSLNDETTPPNFDPNNHWDLSTQSWTVDAKGLYNLNGSFQIKTTYRTWRDDIVSITGSGGSFIIVTFASPHNFVPGSTPVVTISGASAYNGTYSGAFIYDTNSQSPNQIRINGITHTGDIGSGGTFSWNTYNTGYRYNGGIESQNTDNITWEYLNSVGVFKNGVLQSTFNYKNSVPKSTNFNPTFWSGNSFTVSTTVPVQVYYPNQQLFIGDIITLKVNSFDFTYTPSLKYAERAVASNPSGLKSVPVYVDFELVPANGLSKTFINVDAIKQDDLQDGDTLLMNNYIPTKVKQTDLINDLIKRYNIYSTVDPTNKNKILLDTRDDYYANGSQVLDWTMKKDYLVEDKIEFLAELQNKEVLFTYKKDTDFWNKTYTEITGGEDKGDIYGQKKIEYDNDFAKGEKKIETSFSPTPVIPNSVNNRFIVPAIYTSQPKTNIRVLLYNGLKDPNNTSDNAGVYSWYWEWYGTGSTQNRTYYYQYPQALHQDDFVAPTMDINWGEVPYFFNVSGATVTNNNLYNRYWKNYIEQIGSGRLVTSRFVLDEVDINMVKNNLSTRIFVKDSYYYINKIVDYDPTKEGESTEVQLLKIDNPTAFVLETLSGGTVYSDYEAYRITNNPPEDLTNTILSNDVIVKGSNNFVGLNSNGTIVLGDNNSISDNVRNSMVVGDGLEVIDSGAIYLGNAVIDSNGQIMDYSGNSISNDFCASGLTVSVITSCSNGNMKIGTGGVSVIGGDYNSLLGGFNNNNNGNYNSSIIGGQDNTISSGYENSIIGGKLNIISGYENSIIGGFINTVSGYYSSVIGGTNNTTSGNRSSIIGGNHNVMEISSDLSSIIGGNYNRLTGSGVRSVILGGSYITGTTSDTVYVPTLHATSIPAFDNDVDAGSFGLVTGDFYQTTGAGASPLNVAGILMIKQ